MTWQDTAKHIRLYHHFPTWVPFNGWLICERCIKPPSRPTLVPVRRGQWS